MPNEIARLVREIRGDRSQSQFAEITGIHKNVLSDIETGRRDPSKDVARKLSLYSGRPLEAFIGG